MQPRRSWQDAYDAQLSTWRWVTSKDGKAWLLAKYHEEVWKEPTFGDDLKQLSAHLYGVLPMTLRSAPPFYVSGGMCDVVEAARDSFEPEAIYPTDFLTPSGLLYYDRPFPVRDRYGSEIQLRGFSWSPVIAGTDEQIAGIEGANDAGMLEWLLKRREDGEVDGIALTLLAVPKAAKWEAGDWGPPPPLLPIHLTPWWFDMDFKGNEFDLAGRPTAVEEWWKLLQTTLRLMQQRLAVSHREQPTRPQRREAQREGHAGKDVTVIRLRRETSPVSEDHEPGSANYSHRFIVGFHDGGFWRQQHYPSLGPATHEDGSPDPKTHRQIWIAPYEKGPEGAPLVIKPRRVYTWTR